jgi:predicted transcriptional regulator
MNIEEEKYKKLNGDYFGFEIFDEILKEINKYKHPENGMFNAGIANTEGIIKRIREKHYKEIEKMYLDITTTLH